MEAELKPRLPQGKLETFLYSSFWSRPLPLNCLSRWHSRKRSICPWTLHAVFCFLSPLVEVFSVFFVSVTAWILAIFPGLLVDRINFWWFPHKHWRFIMVVVFRGSRYVLDSSLLSFHGAPIPEICNLNTWSLLELILLWRSSFSSTFNILIQFVHVGIFFSASCYIHSIFLSRLGAIFLWARVLVILWSFELTE